MDRRIEERAEFPNGIKCEWEPSPIKPVSDKVKEVSAQIAELNKVAKERGSYLRYRSVANN
jgi:hypothetical protein